MRRKSKYDNSAERLKERIAYKISSLLRRMQTIWVGWMERIVARVSRQTQWFLLITFTITGCILSGTAIIDGLSSHSLKKSGSVQQKDNIAIPELQPAINRSADTVGYAATLRFREYIDSMQQTATGRTLLDKELNKRPGLMDSLHQMEQYYEHLKTNKHGKAK